MPPDGYAWWYMDALSDCGTRALSVIAFIGSVFSPWYAWSRRRAPDNHVCMNVATYGPRARFTMTDRGSSALRQTENRLTIGPSSMSWTGDRLIISVNERGAPPAFGCLRGTITLTPGAVTQVELPLTRDGAHVWRPFAPSAGVQVDLEGDGNTWEGHGYFDANFGIRALEKDFSFWTWGRFPMPDGSAACFYDAIRRDGSTLAQAIRFDAGGVPRPITAPPLTPLPRSLWAVRRETRADPGFLPRQCLAMLDAPFYTRSAVQTQIGGHMTTGVHEALDLRRFRSPLLKPMLAMRVPRVSRWRFSE